MKTIRARDLESVPVDKVDVGMILIEGVVIHASVTPAGSLQVTTASGSEFVMEAGNNAPVLGRVSSELLDAIRREVAAS